MNTVVLEEPVIEARPSRLIAEALVHGHDKGIVTARAREMGLSERVTRAVVCVCCKDDVEQEPINRFTK